MPIANILQPLIDIANAVLVYFHDDLGLSWGGAIILLTVVTRTLLIPLTYKQLKSMRALQAFQPQMKEIQVPSWTGPCSREILTQYWKGC